MAIRKLLYRMFLPLILLICTQANAQNASKDSLLKNALDALSKAKDSATIVAAQENIAIAYKATGDLAKAKEYLLLALAQRRRTGDNTTTSQNLNQLGDIAGEEKDHLKALEYYFSALTLAKESHLVSTSMHSRLSAGQVYLALGNLAGVERYTREGLKDAQQLGDWETIRSASGTLCTVYDSMHNYKLAYDCSLLYKQACDTITNRETNEEIRLLKDRYALEQIAAAAAKEKEAQARQTLQKKLNLAITGAALLLLICIFLLRKRSRTNN